MRRKVKARSHHCQNPSAKVGKRMAAHRLSIHARKQEIKNALMHKEVNRVSLSVTSLELVIEE